MENKLQKIYLTYYSLLIAQDLLQVHYQILLIIYLKDVIELNVIQNMMMKNVESNISTATLFLNLQTLMMIFKDDLILYRCLS